MGDSRYEAHYERIVNGDIRFNLQQMQDDDVIQALAAASTHAPSPYLANVLASEALNRLRRARLVNEHIADGVFVLDAAGRVRSTNPASLAMLGYEAKQLQGRDLSEICVDTGAEGHACVHRRAIEGRTTVHDAHDSFLHADGHVLKVSSTAAPIETEGAVEGVVVAWRDVTAAAQARRALEESEARYRSLFENSPDLVITIDREGRIVALNPAGERLGRKPAAEVLGERVLPFIRPEDQERAAAMLHEAFAGRIRQAEFEVPQPDGSTLIYDAIGVPIIVGDEVVGVHGVARDITRSRRLEEGMRVSIALHDLVMAGVRDHAIVLLGPTRAIESWNPGAERLFGWRTSDVLGHSYVDLFPEGGRRLDAARDALDTADRTGRAEVEGPALRADGSTVFVSGCVNRVVDAHGNAHGYVVVARDATPRHRVHLELRRALAVADALAAGRDLLDEGVACLEGGWIVSANLALAKMLGRPRQEVVGDVAESLFAEGEGVGEGKGDGELEGEGAGEARRSPLETHPRAWTRARLRVAGGTTRDVEVAVRRVDPVEGIPPDGWIVYVRDLGGRVP